MRPSLARGSAQVLRNLAKARASREKYQQLSLEKSDQPANPNLGNHAVVLPRFLGINPMESARKRLEELLDTPGARYEQVWETYLALRQIINLNRSAPIPRETLQKVLRKCTPDWNSTRKYCSHQANRQTIWQRLENPLPFGNRLFEIITHMKEANQVPQKEDFDYMLRYMWAGGHVYGSAAILERMEKEGITPSPSSYKYALQTSVFLLELDIPYSARGTVRETANKFAVDILQRMKAEEKEITPPIMELALRVFRVNGNVEAAEALLRENYAFDIRRPDRMPEEFERRLKEADKSGLPLPQLMPMTTSILTSMVHLYGSLGDIPKMITIFEVLTNPYPLPSNLPSPTSDWWDSEDEYDVPQPVNQRPLPNRSDYVWEPARASPNNATFAYMLRHLAWAGQRMLCEHYMLLAEEYDKAEALRLQTMLDSEIQRYQPSQTQPLVGNENEQPTADDLTAPRFLITPLMFMPVFAYANHQRITELMRWMKYHLAELVKRRESELAFLKSALDALPAGQASTRGLPLNHDTQPYSDFIGIVPRTAQRSPLNLQVHISLVEASLQSFRAMFEKTNEAVARITQRTKERLTRRVWNNKDIYLRDVDARVLVSREEWVEKVRWRQWTKSLPGASLMLEAPSTHGVPPRWMDERLAARAESKKQIDTGDN